MRISQTIEGIVVSHTVKGLNDEGVEVNLENYEWRGLPSIEEATTFAENWLKEKGIAEEIEVITESEE